MAYGRELDEAVNAPLDLRLGATLDGVDIANAFLLGSCGSDLGQTWLRLFAGLGERWARWFISGSFWKTKGLTVVKGVLKHGQWCGGRGT